MSPRRNPVFVILCLIHIISSINITNAFQTFAASQRKNQADSLISSRSRRRTYAVMMASMQTSILLPQTSQGINKHRSSPPFVNSRVSVPDPRAKIKLTSRFTPMLMKYYESEDPNSPDDRTESKKGESDDVVSESDLDDNINTITDNYDEYLDFEYEDDRFEPYFDMLQNGTVDVTLGDEELLELIGLSPVVGGNEHELHSDFQFLDSNLASLEEEEDLIRDDLSLLLWTLDESETVTDETATASDKETTKARSAANPGALERALLEGVVPAGAGVGSGCLPGDYGFDPFNFAEKDLFRPVQSFLLNTVSSKHERKKKVTEGRPKALILRDYREAEIRHGRLAMLAAVIWPLQEILDRIFIPIKFGDTTVVYGGITLPYPSLFMTLIMLLLGYLDIYANAIKDQDAGEAFLPGECFWDPLSILTGATDEMKRMFQTRELLFGRISMMALAFYFIEEAIFHKPLIMLGWNEYFFQPFFQVPEVRDWLDRYFDSPSPTFTFTNEDETLVDFVEVVKDVGIL